MATSWDPAAITASAKNLGSIMNDTSAFDALLNQWPDAGTLPLAEWIERIVDDRRNALVEHAQTLKITLEDMQTSLTQIANNFENTDGDNAAKIKAAIEDLEKQVSGDIGNYQQTTENDQNNYHGGGNGKGDGYSDDLSTPIS